MTEVVPLPMGVVIPCRNCGNHAESYYWFMSQHVGAKEGACPNCLDPWKNQAREIPLRYA
jgi:hypothetical protein